MVEKSPYPGCRDEFGLGTRQCEPWAERLMTSARWPQLFIIGAPRSGTTFLSAVLGAHSDVYVCDMKEPHFFGSPTAGFSYAGPGDNWVNRTWVSDEQKYLSLFSGREERLLCDASTNTLYWEKALEQIESLPESAIYVCVLRDPVDRIESMFFRHRAQGLEPCESIIDAIRSEEAHERTDWSPGFRYVEQSQYFEHISRFAKAVDNRLLTFTFDEVTAEPLVAAKRIWERCGLDTQEVTVPTSQNATPYFSNPILRAMLVRPLALRTIVARVAPARLVAWMQAQRDRRTGDSARLSDEEREFVLERVIDDARRTEELLGKRVLRAAA